MWGEDGREFLAAQASSVRGDDSLSDAIENEA